MGKQYRDIVKGRYLAERSFLYFQYPGDDRIEFYLPMLENPEISENQSANLSEYHLIGRSSNLFAYLGSKSREFSLRFFITLPNIVDYIHNVGLSEMFSPNFRKLGRGLREEELLKFKRGAAVNKDFNFDYYDNAYADLVALDPRFERVERSNFATQIDRIFRLDNQTSIQNNVTMRDAVNYLILWINVIRTSTINNSTRTSLGPPMVYLNHGTMYNNIPCVCKSFSIRLNTPLGYDLVSLTPRQVEISLSLAENRVGNFKEFVPFKYKQESENLAGWEAIVGGGNNNGTMDPYNQITSSRTEKRPETVQDIFNALR